MPHLVDKRRGVSAAPHLRPTSTLRAVKPQPVGMKYVLPP